MIISHRFKYIFVGLPYSASGAVSRELVHNYFGKPILSKHSNIPTLIKKYPDIKIDDYYIFAIARDPIDITFTVYNKLLLNKNNIYNNPTHFTKNGGFISNKKLKLFKKVHKGNLSFPQYLNSSYRYHPYDNDLSINIKYLNGIIRFNHLNDDFKKVLDAIDMKSKGDIPVFNRAAKKVKMDTIEKQVIKKIFGPFYVDNKIFDSQKFRIPFIRNAIYRSYQILRYYKRLRDDTKFIDAGKYKDVFLKN